MNIVGVDPSLSATGIATYAETYTIRTEAGDSERLAHIYNGVTVAATPPGGCDLAIIEDLPKHAQGAGLTGMAQGVVRLALIRAGVRYVVVTPGTLKKFATGSGNATKPDMRMELFKRTGLDLRDDNQVDAWFLRQIGLHLTEHPDRIELPKTHLAALDKVEWP